MADSAGSTFAEAYSSIRTLLDDPSASKPNPRVILEHYKTEAQLLLNQAQNSSISWAVRSFTLTTQPDKDTYQIIAPDFGKDVLVHTLDENNPYHVERTINRTTLQSREAEYFGPKKVIGATLYHTAQVFVFYRSDGGAYIQIRPMPSGSVKYKIWYEVVLVGGGNIDEDTTPIIPCSHPYLHLRVARACLPYADWPELNSREKAQKRQEMAAMFSISIGEQRDAFLRYIATDRQQGVTRRRGFDDDQYVGDQGYWPDLYLP